MVSELITDEVVDLLAQRRYEVARLTDKYPENWPAWEELQGPHPALTEAFRDAFLNGARADLKAAAPLIAARALDGARKELQRAYKAGPGNNLQESSPSGWQKGFARAHRIVRDFQREVTGR